MYKHIILFNTYNNSMKYIITLIVIKSKEIMKSPMINQSYKRLNQNPNLSKRPNVTQLAHKRFSSKNKTKNNPN